MPRQEQLRQLFEIDRLIRTGKYPHPQSLAVEFEVDPRVIYYDRLFMQKEWKAPIKFDRKNGGWYYSHKNWTLPSYDLARSEVLALLLAVEAARARHLERLG